MIKFKTSETFSKSLNFQFFEMMKSTGIILILCFFGNCVSGAVQRRIQENSWVCHIRQVLYYFFLQIPINMVPHINQRLACKTFLTVLEPPINLVHSSIYLSSSMGYWTFSIGIAVTMILTPISIVLKHQIKKF